MYFDSVEEFIAMGGHGLYVWMAYGVVAASVSIWLLVQTQRRRRVLAQLPARIARSELS
ncbi:MAG: heme exporter protein CcmD [Pseudomonadales bacterium]